MARGKLREDLYNDYGEVTEQFLLEAGGDTPMLQIPVGQWHSLEVLEKNTIIFEAKDSAYEPLTENDLME